MLDEQVTAVLRRLEQEDADERAAGVARELRARSVAPTTGRFLFSLVAPQTDCEVLEIGSGRGYSTIWLGAGVRYLGGRVLSIERDPEAAARWRENVREAGLEDWVELVEGEALEVLSAIDDVFDLVFLDAAKTEYEAYFELARERVEPGALVVADNVLSHPEELGSYIEARRADPGLLTVTVPLDRGLELSVVLTEPASLS
jgi:predicted O-methyltransferase YrrM